MDWRLERADAHRGDTAVAEAQLRRGGLGQVDDALAHEGAAIVDRHFDFPTGILVSHLDLGAKGQRSMRGSHGIFIEDLTRGSGFAVKARTVPGGAATLGIAGGGKGKHKASKCGDGEGFSNQYSNS